MSNISIVLPDGSTKEVASGSTAYDVAAAISSSLKKQAVAAKVNGKLVDLSTPVHEGDQVEIVTVDSEEGLGVLRHSTAHLMAQAVKRLYGQDKVKLGVGPVIENGFYYDMDLPQSLSDDDLARIEQEMEKIVLEDLPIKRRVVSKEEALRIYQELGDPYKIELIEELPEDETITIYEQGEFFDLCRGPHVPSTGKLKVFKLLSVSGAYWRGDSDNPMLQRVYGTAWPKKSQVGSLS